MLENLFIPDVHSFQSFQCSFRVAAFESIRSLDLDYVHVCDNVSAENMVIKFNATEKRWVAVVYVWKTSWNDPELSKVKSILAIFPTTDHAWPAVPNSVLKDQYLLIFS